MKSAAVVSEDHAAGVRVCTGPLMNAHRKRPGLELTYLQTSSEVLTPPPTTKISLASIYEIYIQYSVLGVDEHKSSICLGQLSLQFNSRAN